MLKQLLVAVEHNLSELVKSKFSGVTYQDIRVNGQAVRVFEFSKNDLFSDIMRHMWTNRDIAQAVANMHNVTFDSNLQVFQITVKLPVDVQ